MAEPYADRFVVRSLDDVDTPALLALVWGAAPVRTFLPHAQRAFDVSPPSAPRHPDQI